MWPSISVRKMWLITLSLVVFDVALVMQLFAVQGVEVETGGWDFRIAELKQLEAASSLVSQTATGRAVLGESAQRDEEDRVSPLRRYFPGIASAGLADHGVDELMTSELELDSRGEIL